MKAKLILLALMVVPMAAQARDLSVKGQLGFIGEWEVAANLHENASGSGADFVGPLTLRHIGLCTANGPVEKAGDMRVRRAGLFGSRLEATLRFDGRQCDFTARGANTYEGVLQCPSGAIPLRLQID